MEQATIGYVLLALMILAGAALVLLKLYHSRDGAYRRRIRRETDHYTRRMADRGDL